VSLIDEVANGLADEVVRDGEADELVLYENFLKALALSRRGGG
jgi:hypothetical protein